MTLLEYIESLVPEGKFIDAATPGQIIIKPSDIDEINCEGKLDMLTSQALDYIVELFTYTKADARYKYTTPCRVPPEVQNIIYSNMIILDEAQVNLMNTLQIIEDPEVKGYDSIPKYPYYRLRGKPVTPEQALDIIRRTDNIFSYKEKELMGADYVGNLNFINDWLEAEENPARRHGWCHPDGTIGANSLTTKYPNWGEFLYEILGYKMAFPYLDFVIALTTWDNFPDYVWEQMGNDTEQEDSDYPDFLDYIDYGIWVHDQTIEFMEPSRAKAKYQEYVALYGVEDTSKYISGYYKNVYNTEEYYKRCCERNATVNVNKAGG